MERSLRFLAITILLAGVLAGCATMTSRTELGGLPNADHPEYMVHPLRLIALPFHAVGTIMRYAVVEPFYFALSPTPDFVGLSMEERRQIDQRGEAWSKYFAGERPLVQ